MTETRRHTRSAVASEGLARCVDSVQARACARDTGEHAAHEVGPMLTDLISLPRRRSAPVRDTSQARVPLLAFVADDDTETALRGGLLNTVEGVDIRRGTILHAIRHLAKEPTPRALVVDISGVRKPAVRAGQPRRRLHAGREGAGARRGRRCQLLSRAGAQHGRRRIRAQAADA